MNKAERKEMEQAIDLNVVILPNKQVSEKLVEWSMMVSDKFQTHYTLSLDDRIPHFSLYSAQYPERNSVKIEREIGRIASMQEPLEITLSEFSVFSGYLFYDVVQNENMKTLHGNIVDALNPLREGHISDVQRGLTGLTERQKEVIEKYGYVSVKDLYMPHISLTRLVDPNLADEAVKLLPKEELKFEAQEIVLSPFGQFGTCPEILARFLLKNT